MRVFVVLVEQGGTAADVVVNSVWSTQQAAENRCAEIFEDASDITWWDAYEMDDESQPDGCGMGALPEEAA